METEHHEETGAQSEGAHAVGYANSLVGHFTAQETLRRGSQAVASLRAQGLITFPQDRVKPVEESEEPEEENNYNEWRESLNLQLT